MVVEGEHGKVTVFVVPHNDSYLSEGSSRDSRYNSQAIDLKRASIIVVGEEGANISEMQEQLNRKIQFSA
jgi:hypothetical protein